ncbi:MAG: LppX_LprAFG lipoprotein [Candidatus Dormibacteraeota bacterium]|uniref:LppX_LprAFG lipoprotein n=1 Tax=Candidatus Amunia macphersoniae TaxID=3127014 RepID=A0A934KPN5_9BACT|nr:LppX_LprAFG lipoprotein [Candidatus Dormibacteraeota bacterium]
MRVASRVLVAGFGLLVAACGTPPVDPAQLLRDAKQSVDSASALHFTLTSQNVSGGSGPLITGGDGDAKRPDGFAGSLRVVDSGFSVSVEVVSAGGTFYARTPLSSTFDKTEPSKYGFGDPGKLLDPSNGLSSLLGVCSSPANAAGDRLNSEQLAEVTCAIPGARVAALLTSADPSQAVQATVGVDASSHQLRRVVMVGPFFDKAHPSTFTVVLDKYGEAVSITPPAG